MAKKATKPTQGDFEELFSQVFGKAKIDNNEEKVLVSQYVALNEAADDIINLFTELGFVSENQVDPERLKIDIINTIREHVR